MIIGGRNIVYTDISVKVNNIRTNDQNDSSEFEGLLHKMVLNNPFVSQEIFYVIRDGERKIYTVSAYIK